MPFTLPSIAEHPGQRKTYNALHRSDNWPNMASNVRKSPGAKAAYKTKIGIATADELNLL